VKRVSLAKRAIFLEGQLVGSFPLVLCGGVIPILALLTRKNDDFTHIHSPAGLSP
jgi:hypothetical protein